MRALLLALTALLVPGLAFASTVETSKTLVVSEPPAGNAYAFGGDLTVAAPVTADLTAGGGSVVVSAPVAGDALIAGGSVDIRKAVQGDLRVVGGRVMVDDAVTGDLVALAGSISVKASPAFAYVAGLSVSFENGAKGPVTIYGSSVNLAGTFEGTVDVVATDHLTIAPGTVIHGALNYDAPARIEVPTTASVTGKVTYTGKSFLPTSEEARSFAVAGSVLFFVVKILAALIAAGLFAGLFPRFAAAVVERTIARTPTRFIILALLGFGVLVAGPVLILILLVSFAGALIAFVVLALYVLLLLLAYIYAAIIAGGALARGVAKRTTLYWRDAVFGMLALSVIGLIPVIGWLVLLILMAAAAGAIVSLAYRFAFPEDEETVELL